MKNYILTYLHGYWLDIGFRHITPLNEFVKWLASSVKKKKTLSITADEQNNWNTGDVRCYIHHGRSSHLGAKNICVRYTIYI